MADILVDRLTVLLPRLLAALDRLEVITRQMHPARLQELAGTLGPDDGALMASIDAVRAAEWPPILMPYKYQIEEAGDSIIRAHAGLRAAALSANGTIGAYRATRQQYRAIEALYPLIPALPSISQFFVAPARRDDAALLARLHAADRKPGDDTGVYHFKNDVGTGRLPRKSFKQKYTIPRSPTPCHHKTLTPNSSAVPGNSAC